MDVADALLDERRELTGLPRLTRCLGSYYMGLPSRRPTMTATNTLWLLMCGGRFRSGAGAAPVGSAMSVTPYLMALTALTTFDWNWLGNGKYP